MDTHDEEFGGRIRQQIAADKKHSESTTHNCSTCDKPLLNKSNTTLKEGTELKCHQCWSDEWSLLFQLTREGKYDLIKKTWTLTKSKP